MAVQRRLPLHVRKGDFGPMHAIAAASRSYAKERGLDYGDTDRLHGLQADSSVTTAVGQAYAGNIGSEPSPELLESYGHLRREVAEQYHFMTSPRESGGLGIRHEVTPHDPYGTPDELRADVAGNRRVQTFSSRTTGPHSVLSFEENDQFRAVHDVFGHLAIGRNFGRHGEEAAAQHHAMMFSPRAHLALMSETRGQNSYYHSRGDFPDDQAPVDIPGWAAHAEVSGPPKKPGPTVTQRSLF